MKTVLTARGTFAVIFFCLFALSQDIATAQTSNSCVSPLNADFITKYTIVEAADYTETNLAGPVPTGPKAFGFAAIIKLATNLDGTASTAMLTIPGGQPTRMNPLDPTEFIVGVATNAFTNITSSFPDGTYEFAIFNNTVSVTLPAGASLPNPPTLSDYAADQAIDAGKDFAFSWEPFNTGGVIDLISVSLVSETNGLTVFKSPDYGCPGVLDGRSTSVLIPANTLSSNTTYRASIVFLKVYTYDTTSVSESALLAGTEARTSTIISTGAASGRGPAPALENAALLPGGSVRFDITTTLGLNYIVQFSGDLKSWTPLLATNAPGSVLSFTNLPPAGAAGFYRVAQQ